jgi:hypothetical protein
MIASSTLVLVLSLLAPHAACAPAASPSTYPLTSATAATATPTVSPAPDTPNSPLWGPDTTGIIPEPVHGQTGASILGPQNVPLELQNADLLAPPTTDEGSVRVDLQSVDLWTDYMR